MPRSFQTTERTLVNSVNGNGRKESVTSCIHQTPVWILLNHAPNSTAGSAGGILRDLAVFAVAGKLSGIRSWLYHRNTFETQWTMQRKCLLVTVRWENLVAEKVRKNANKKGPYKKDGFVMFYDRIHRRKLEGTFQGSTVLLNWSNTIIKYM